MKFIEKLKKSEQGSVTIYVLSVLLVLIIVGIIIANLQTNKLTTQLNQTNKIQNEYNATNEQVQEIYENITTES